MSDTERLPIQDAHDRITEARRRILDAVSGHGHDHMLLVRDGYTFEAITCEEGQPDFSLYRVDEDGVVDQLHLSADGASELAKFILAHPRR